MKKKTKIICRISSLMLTLLMVLSVFTTLPVTATAATTEKVEKTYDIAVVYDNSGSMYVQGNMAWSRAKYAMEIFASMLDYNKDKLTIYPMWAVTTDGSQPAATANSNDNVRPVSITSKADIDKITNMFTIDAATTPFEPVVEAYESLQRSNADEKWLIILTDGEFNHYYRGDEVDEDTDFGLKARLDQMTGNGIKMQYLGIGEAEDLPSDVANQFYAKKSTDVSLMGDLIDICNSMFNRSILPADRLNGNTLNLDLSMKNLFVFVQGADAKIVSLKNSGGQTIGDPAGVAPRKYSTIRAGRYDWPERDEMYRNAPYDTSLAGHIVTFEGCPKGTYTLDYVGDRDKIQIFYEPDVDIAVKIYDSFGEEVTKDYEMIEGEYTIETKLVDAQTGEDVTNHKLLGGNVSLTTNLSTDGGQTYQEYGPNATVMLKADSVLDMYVEGTYLGKYKISTRDSNLLDWLKGKIVLAPAVDLRIEVIKEQDQYVLTERDTWKTIKVTLYIDGMLLTQEQWDATRFELSVSDGLTCRIEPVPNESAYIIHIAQDADGNELSPEDGEYTITAIVENTNEEGRKTRGKTDDMVIEILQYPTLWKILFWSAVVLLLLIIWLIYMTRKVLPKKIVLDPAGAEFDSISVGTLDYNFIKLSYKKKSRRMTIEGPPSAPFNEQCSATLTLKPIDNRFTPSKKRRCVVTAINSSADTIKLGGTPYSTVEGTWMKQTEVGRYTAATNPTPPVIEHTLSCSSMFEIANDGLSSLRCKMKTVK